MNNNNPLNVLAAWRTSNRVTEFFIENLPRELWSMKVPGAPRKTVRMIAGHIHNARCSWIKMIGRAYGIRPPKSVDRHRVSKAGLLRAFKQSSRGISELLKEGLNQGGKLKIQVPWANIPPDVVHFMAYMVAHEAHHRGQIILLAREAGHRLPPHITDGLWQWKQHNMESAAEGRHRKA